ncbi:phosphoglycerol geranylgeranyltransferase [Methanosphaerula palustris]|uniref:Geranylgeranylglyceryl phosphate synthase n=1 Tax=Methanosphaerula palustris (strain ATCC BAA-1556 / DSM 19958 / E1-9c) TaxID=521011 RepID=GGGPS_METPE|nr:phosphoglycerol geranylgeranyltransferase [Methanosphaerula palustris]B8GHM9.1 RecName: Full=Geranylgeranylglyceryl phosphate synthase; Short=GGGP synthase; Short=GGGPS; AltName: Full=(S)-3-O-geranylgeranylglyceryl phosphate synthase; AltName: Full=Phosphoglycerol geranylgeranyltransferase [Methanosphaerula palustris E1-9c]ACL16634.1 geranylgeranylglyceryl phosphate synthase family protein [Methanosphaerula palustris E1-9c]
MQNRWKDWVHVTKLDPDKSLPPAVIDEIATSGTDALMLSGTLNVTIENLGHLFKQVAQYGLPLVVEPAGPEAVLCEGIDLLFVPSVMNSNSVQWIVGKHQQWAQQSSIRWDKVIPEAYIVLNSSSSVGKVTGADCGLTPAEAAAYASVADHYFRFPIVYVEYSGMYGDPKMVRSIAEVVDRAILYYGGGISSADKAAEMGRWADTIVVGNAVYDLGPDVLRATVKAVQ